MDDDADVPLQFERGQALVDSPSMMLAKGRMGIMPAGPELFDRFVLG
jgi:hypothetical protein